MDRVSPSQPHHCVKCDLPLAEPLCQLGCSHIYHETCLNILRSKSFLDCACCRSLIENVTILTDLSGEDQKCPICFESMKDTASRLNQKIFQHSNGGLYHKGCFPEDVDPMEQIQASIYLEKHPNPEPVMINRRSQDDSSVAEDRIAAANTYVQEVVIIAVKRLLWQTLDGEHTDINKEVFQGRVLNVGRAAYSFCFPEHDVTAGDDLIKAAAKKAYDMVQTELNERLELINSFPDANPIDECEQFVKIAIACTAIFLIISAIVYLLMLIL